MDIAETRLALVCRFIDQGATANAAECNNDIRIMSRQDKHGSG